MKRILLSLFTVAAFNFGVSAQGVATLNPTLVVNGTDADWILVAAVTVQNTSNNTLDIMCQRTSNILANGQTSSFCWGVSCYGDTTNICTSPVNLTAGGSTNSFIGDLHVNASLGTSYVTYKFFDASNANDFSQVTFQYNVIPTGIEENNLNPTMIAPQPNPADRFTSIGYSLKSNPSQFKIEIYNLTGAKVASYSLNNKVGFMIIPTEELQSGIYFCALKQNNNPVSTQKLIVSHK